MITPIFFGTIQNNKIILEDEDPYVIWLGSFEGKEIELVVRAKKSKRSTQQNKYLWSCVYKLISDEVGYTMDEIHSLCKSMFLKQHLDVKEKRYVVVGSTTGLNTADFTNYIEKIKDWSAQELNINIPDADRVEI